jgi:hypothetical protein
VDAVAVELVVGDLRGGDDGLAADEVTAVVGESAVVLLA